MTVAGPIGPDVLIGELGTQYISLKDQINGRIADFRSIWQKKDSYGMLRELLFCILTPQSKAITCWEAVENLTRKDLLFNGTYDEVLEAVGAVRFKYRKASYILEARKKFIKDGRIILVDGLDGFENSFLARDWLVNEVKGYGFKEASHFLRNIGLGEDLSILDRHILKNLFMVGVIDKVPSSMTERKYKEIEGKMMRFANAIDIPMSHLDLLFWYREAGSIFK